MSNDLRNEPGIRQAEVIFGKEVADFLADFWSEVDPEFGRGICNWAYGQMYSRTVLPTRDRELCACMALIVLNRQPELDLHIRAALKAGATRKEITEVILQAHLYAGIPTTMGALKTMRSVFASLDAPAPT